MIPPVYLPSYGPFPPKTPENDLALRRTGLPGGQDVVGENGFLYIISRAEDGTDHGALRIYDVRGEFRDAPKPLGCVCGLGNARQIEVRDGLAAIVCREGGLYLISVRDPEAPRIICHYDTVELATGVTFYDRYIFVACRSFGVEIIDISDPSRPRHVSSIRAGEVQSVWVDDGILYTGSWGEHQVNVIDVHNALSPKKLAVIPLDGKGDGVYAKDGILYAAIGQHRAGCHDDPTDPGYGRGNGFEIFDVSDPSAPVLLSETLFEFRYYYISMDMWDVTVCGHYAVISHTFNGVFIYDVTDPRHPVLAGHLCLPTDGLSGPAGRIDAVYDPKQNERLPRPIIFPFDPEKLRCAPVTGTAAADGRLYIVSVYENLHVASSDTFFRIPEPQKNVPLISDAYDMDPGADTEGVLIRRTAGQVHGAALISGTIAAACGEDGIRLYEPEKLGCLACVKTEGFAMDIRAAKGLLFAACGADGLYVLSLDGEKLSVVGRWCDPGHNVMQAVPAPDGRHVIIHLDDRYVCVLNTSDPAAPFEESRKIAGYGLVYHRQLTANGADDRYFAGYWNGNFNQWYDLSGEKAVPLSSKQGKLGFRNGITGLPEGHSHLAVTGGGYVISDIFNDNEDYGKLPVIRVPDTKLYGKPVFFAEQRLLILSDRVGGNVFVIDAADIRTPRLIRRWIFSGHPEPADCDGRYIILPLGHEGIGRARLSDL